MTAVEIEAGRVAWRGAGASAWHRAEVVVLAAGAWSRDIAGLPEAARPPVRPLKGQALALRMDPVAPLIEHVLWVPKGYLVPRNDGRLLVGATVEERGFDDSLTAGGGLRPARKRLARAAGDRGVADRRILGRLSARQPRRSADPGADPGRVA